MLHVLPHPGGGGETYVDFLSTMPGYRSTRIFLAPSPTPTVAQLARGVARAFRRTRSYDLLHVHGDAAAGLCLPVLAARPSVVTFNGLHLLRRLSGVTRTAAALGLRAAILASDRTICVSRTERDYLRQVVGSTAERRAVVIHNGVRVPSQVGEVERSAVRQELGLENADAVGIWVGSLDERKDPLAAVRAAASAALTLLVVGDGPLRPQVERAAPATVRVLGSRSDVPRLLGAADIYVLTSHREGLAFSLLEAMAHGVPPVVTDVAENVEAVGDAGVVVPEGDKDALVAALRRLAENERERAALGRRARDRVAERFDAERMIARTRTVYDEVLGK